MKYVPFEKLTLFVISEALPFAMAVRFFFCLNVLSLFPALLLKTPVIKLSQAIGPFKNRLNRFFANQVLSRCQQVFSRGDFTSNHLNELRLPNSRWSRAADVAFSWQPKYSLTEENETAVNELEHRIVDTNPRFEKTVVIVPSSLVRKKSATYTQSLATSAIELSEAGCQVVLLPNATRQPEATRQPNANRQQSEKGRNNDLVAIREIVEMVRNVSPQIANSIVSVDFDLNTESIRKLMAHADVVVTSRFHGMVASLAAGIPTIVVGWSHKYREVMELIRLWRAWLRPRTKGCGLNKNRDGCVASAERISTSHSTRKSKLCNNLRSVNSVLLFGF